MKISPIKKPHTVQNDKASLNESLNSSRSMSDAKMMLKHFEFLRIVLCVMVAYLCRRVLSSGYGIFYFEVRIAFLKVEIHLFCPGNCLKTKNMFLFNLSLLACSLFIDSKTAGLFWRFWWYMYLSHWQKSLSGHGDGTISLPLLQKISSCQ